VQSEHRRDGRAAISNEPDLDPVTHALK
jgi:hypothetical protein